MTEDVFKKQVYDGADDNNRAVEFYPCVAGKPVKEVVRRSIVNLLQLALVGTGVSGTDDSVQSKFMQQYRIRLEPCLSCQYNDTLFGRSADVLFQRLRLSTAPLISPISAAQPSSLKLVATACTSEGLATEYRGTQTNRIERWCDGGRSNPSQNMSRGTRHTSGQSS